jgi:hypothetical protein
MLAPSLFKTSGAKNGLAETCRPRRSACRPYDIAQTFVSATNWQRRPFRVYLHCEKVLLNVKEWQQIIALLIASPTLETAFPLLHGTPVQDGVRVFLETYERLTALLSDDG